MTTRVVTVGVGLVVTVVLLLFAYLLFAWSAQAMNVVKIAHLHPNNPNMVHEPQVMKMCYHDMKERQILPGEINFE
jgi:uncharacterized membrane protein